MRGTFREPILAWAMSKLMMMIMKIIIMLIVSIMIMIMEIEIYFTYSDTFLKKANFMRELRPRLVWTRIENGI